MSTPPPSGWKAKPCPQCGKPASYASRPFCSERCRMVDLGKWVSESYVIPGEDAAPSADDYGNGEGERE